MLCLALRHVILEAVGERLEGDGGEGNISLCFTAGFMSNSAR